MPTKGWSKKEGRVVSPTTGKRKRQMLKYWREQQKKKDPLTEREKQILYYIRSYQYEERSSPTATEISLMLLTSVSNIIRYFKSLEQKGYIELTKDKRMSRCIKFPKGTSFPWEDEKQFPRTVFPPPKKAGF